jgi:hypothetical protein
MVCPLSPYFLYDILDTILSLVWPPGSPVITEGLQWWWWHGTGICPGKGPLRDHAKLTLFKYKVKSQTPEQTKMHSNLAYTVGMEVDLQSLFGLHIT